MVSSRALDPVALLATSMFLVVPFVRSRRGTVACFVAVAVAGCLLSGTPAMDGSRGGPAPPVASAR